MRLRIEPLGNNHDRAAFSCGHDSVDDFLKKAARQRQERKIGTTMVAIDVDGDPSRIVGFYVLLPHEFRGEELPDPHRKGSRVGSLSAVPGALLAQLGVAMSHQGHGVGKTLVAHALQRVLALSEEFGCVAVVTDPIDERACKLYEAFDFQPLSKDSRRLIVSVRTIRRALDSRDTVRTGLD